MAKFTSLQVDVTGEDEVLLTFETNDGATFGFSASADDVDVILEALEEAIEEADEETEEKPERDAKN